MPLRQNQPDKVLAVCYGGGHVLMLIPVLKYLQSLGYELQVLGLTTAAAALRKAGFSPLGFRDILRPEDSRAHEHGTRLAADMHHGSKVNSLDESVAYLGLSYADLEDQVGVEGAREAFREKGRQAFLPLNPMRRFFDLLQPDVLLTTNSPRAELASIQVAAERGIPSVGVLDLFGLQPYNDIPTDYVCVPFKQAVSILAERGLDPGALTVTGNPNFDWVHKVLEAESKAPQWRRVHQIKPDELLALYAMKPNWDEHEEMIVSSLEQLLPQKPELKIAVRPHPNSDSQLATSVISRLGAAAFVDDRTPLPMAIETCDLLITHKSTVAVEAALLGRQVALFHSNHDYPTHGIPLHLYNWGSYSISVAEGVQALSLLKKESAALQHQRGTEVRTAWNCDGRSHIRIAEVVIRALHDIQQTKAA
ncbi:glycosyltransferase family protein [Gimesia algae]|uniref:Capsule polysaccharide biosynthesis protein n=1 Tax=Gimesia algae TaxID=2527971 RepID=A0A517VAT0_9PLAN|nr:hypothetical protein [Gimesia algae]QDT90114.1 Capsule polysaccharide biosynthesis protein [Gimesia algae]